MGKRDAAGRCSFFWQWGKKCVNSPYAGVEAGRFYGGGEEYVNSPHAGVEAGRFYGGGGCEIAARRMQKLLPGGCSDSEKQEALSFLCHVCWLRPERRLIRHPWLAGAFWGHPCPQILNSDRKLRASSFSPKSHPPGKSFCIRLVSGEFT